MQDDLKALPGIKEKQLVALGACAVCGKAQLAHGDVSFYEITIRRGGFVLDALKRRAGLGVALGSDPLAAIMGPDEDLAKVLAGPKTVFVSESCAALVPHLVLLFGDEA
jgi:hypothetical protein